MNIRYLEKQLARVVERSVLLGYPIKSVDVDDEGGLTFWLHGTGSYLYIAEPPQPDPEPVRSEGAERQ